LRDAPTNINWTGPIGVTLDVGAPIEWRASTTLSAASWADWSAFVAGTVATPVEMSGSLQGTSVAPEATNSELLATRLAPIEWRGGFFVDNSASPIEWRALDATAPTSWLLVATSDVFAPVEFGGRATTPISDANVALEFGSVSAASVDSGTSWFVQYHERHAKGSATEGPAPAETRTYHEGSGPKGGTVTVQSTVETRKYREGTGPKGATLER
jgi:hypothetical protein